MESKQMEITEADYSANNITFLVVVFYFFVFHFLTKIQF